MEETQEANEQILDNTDIVEGQLDVDRTQILETYTKSEVDKILTDKFAELQIKLEPTTPANDVTAILAKANERLLIGTVKGAAADLRLTIKGANAAIKLADFSDCTTDDEVDETKILAVLEKFVDEYPEFKQSTDMGTGSSSNPARPKVSSSTGIGARLAKSQAITNAKSSFFKK